DLTRLPRIFDCCGLLPLRAVWRLPKLSTTPTLSALRAGRHGKVPFARIPQSAQTEEALQGKAVREAPIGCGHAGAPTRPLKRDDEPVISALFRHAVDVGEHLLTEMREDNALGPDFSLVRDEVGIVEVEPDGLAEEVALRDEEIGAVGQSRHVLRPFAVARVSNYLVVNFDTHGCRIGRLGVDGRKCRDPDVSNVASAKKG